MREILFRAKKKNWNELPEEQQWVEGYYCTIKSGHYTAVGFKEEYKDCIIKEFSDGGINFANADPSTVCQYTGLTDRNGRKIFEGDIVRFDDCSNYPIFWDNDYCAFGSCWYSDFDHLSKYRNVKMEVIGNIFDNADLMKG